MKAVSNDEEEGGEEFDMSDDDGNVADSENYDAVIDEMFALRDESICSSIMPSSDTVTVDKSRHQICNELQDVSFLSTGVMK